MKKFLTIFGIFFLILFLLLGVGYLTLKGKIPLLSDKILSQKDLGINESPDEIYAFYDEIGYVDGLKGEEPKSGELLFEGTIDIEHTFTQSEINSWLSAWEQGWADIPFRNLQIKLNSDNTVEASALISVKKAESIGKMLGYSDEEIEKAKEYLGYIPDPLPLYATGTASISNNVPDLNVRDFKVVGISLPQGLIQPVTNVLSDIMERGTNMSGAQTDIQSAEVTEAGVEFVGTVPAKVSISKE
jgi:hypothetical protein